MKIYVVTHFYNNGESYDDYREYTEYYMFSTEGKAYAFYCDHILSDYEGNYSIIEWELDTQEETLLEKSPWVKCSRMYSCDDWPEDYEPEYNPEDYYPDPMESYKECWRWDDMNPYDDIPEEEDKAWLEYVTTPGTNYRMFEEAEEEFAKRKEAMMINSSPNAVKLLDELVELLNI